MLLKFGKVLVMKTLYRKTGRRWIDVIYYRKGKCTEKPMSLKQKHPDKPTRTTHTHTFAHSRSHILNRSAKCLAFLFRFCEKVKPMMGENLALKRFHLVPVLRKRIHLTSSPWSDIYIRCVLCLWNSCSRLTQLIILMLFGFFVLAIFFFLGEFQFKPFDGSFSWGVCVCADDRKEWMTEKHQVSTCHPKYMYPKWIYWARSVRLCVRYCEKCDNKILWLACISTTSAPKPAHSNVVRVN